MKLNETKLFVFLASMIIGILVVMNISFGITNHTEVLTAGQYQKSIDEKNRLFGDIDFLEKQYTENLNKQTQYNTYMPSDSEVVKSIKKELDFNRRLLGIDEVEGEGIIITLNDATTSFVGTIEEDEYLQWAKIVHNTDVLELVNSLRTAGAEAIAINGQRIVSNSEFYCWGPFLKINGVNISAPFYISVLGSADGLKQYLLSEDGYLNFLKYRGIFVSLQKENSVKIPGYIGNMQFRFTEEIKNN